MNSQELQDFLNEKVDIYNTPDFITDDPLQIPHRFSLKQDIEISGFLAATIAWGNRKSIIKSADKILDIMANSPYDFILNFKDSDVNSIREKAVHRTFNGEDLWYFFSSLKSIYTKYDSLEPLFVLKEGEENMYHAFHRFREGFLELNPLHRSSKHISSTYKNASAKRLMMYLRWMARKDNRGVDFGLWQQINPKFLSIPLDVHTGTISRKLELIKRKQNDWKTVEELDTVIRTFDPNDPAKYDFALFGLGVTNELEI